MDDVSEALVESGFEEAAQLSRCPELGNRVEVLECRGECVGQAPYRAWLELLVLRIEIQVVNAPSEVSRNIQLALDERLVDDHFGGYVGQFGLTPRLDLPAHGLEIPLHPIHTDGDRVDERERLRVLRKHRREVPAERHVRTNEHAISAGEGQAHRLIVRIAEPNREPS